MGKVKRLLAKGAATHFIWASYTLPGLLKTRGFSCLMDRIFSWMAPSYDRIWQRLDDASVILGPLLAGLKALPTVPERCIDLACGTGLATFALQRHFPYSRVVGTDLSAQMIRIFKKKIDNSRPGLPDALVCNSASLPFVDGSFDLVMTQNAPPYLEEMIRALRPGGALLMAYSFVFAPLVRGILSRRLREAGLEDLIFVQAEEGVAVIARKSVEELR